MLEYTESSHDWEHTPGEEPLRIFYHFYKGPELPFGPTEDGFGQSYVDMSRLVVVDVLLQHESVLYHLDEFIPSWEDYFDEINELLYLLTTDCEG